MIGKLTGEGEDVPKKHCHFHREKATFGHRHENKSYLACPKQRIIKCLASQRRWQKGWAQLDLGRKVWSQKEKKIRDFFIFFLKKEENGH